MNFSPVKGSEARTNSRNRNRIDAQVYRLIAHPGDGFDYSVDRRWRSPSPLSREVKDDTVGGDPGEHITRMELIVLAGEPICEVHVWPPSLELECNPFAHYSTAVASVGESRLHGIEEITNLLREWHRQDATSVRRFGKRVLR